MVRTRGRDGRIPRRLGRGESPRMAEEEHFDASASASEPVGYPGGPYDTSLLVKYEQHVSYHIWFGEERGSKKELKVVGHGLKLIERVPLQLPREMESWISRSGLASLQRTSLTKIDTNLVSAFAERWHLETSSFHMLFSEMTITLDDVSFLLHLPLRGVFWSPQDISEALAVEWVVDYLGVSQRIAQQQVRECRGSYYKLEWLYDRFVEHRAASRWDYATRAYLLMLVGSTIFADKMFMLVEARYLSLFIDLCRLRENKVPAQQKSRHLSLFIPQSRKGNDRKNLRKKGKTRSSQPLSGFGSRLRKGKVLAPLTSVVLDGILACCVYLDGLVLFYLHIKAG
ncbi:unnamed protein product [Lathyrus sativus]|nr:unnamed protein product [Lathyrus sativus]